jgi:prepilin-type N-terminal cleavage/methylation domain-containing protein
MHRKSGFTLVEIIVAAALFGLVIVGLLSVFVAGAKHMVHARERMVGVQLGKLFIDPLQLYVREDTWDNTANQLKLGDTSATDQRVNNRQFSAAYHITDVGGSLRRVTTHISWTE